MPPFLLDFLFLALVVLAVFCVAGVAGWVFCVSIPSLFANATVVPSSGDSCSIPPLLTRRTILAILSLAPLLVDIHLVGSFVVDMVMTVGSTLKRLVAIEFKAPGSCWSPRFNKFVFFLKFHYFFSLSPFHSHKDSVHPSGLYTQLPNMLSCKEDEARLMDLYIPCTFPGCLKAFQTNGGLTRHLRSIHPNWVPVDEEGQLDSVLTQSTSKFVDLR